MTEPQPSRGFRWTQAAWGPALVCDPLAVIAPHLFTVGNLRLRDDPGEWEAIASTLGVSRDRLRLVRQVHSAAVTSARAGDASPWTPDEADAIVTDDRSLAIAVRVADCAPILIADRRTGAVAAVHAGWRGTVQSIAREGVSALRREFGSEPRDLVAAIGPCLGSCCGEVGPEVVEAFRAAGHSSSNVERWFSTGVSGRPYLDLWGANRDQLIAAGIPDREVHVAGLCSKTHAGLMHSYRAHGAGAGRMLAVIRRP